MAKSKEKIEARKLRRGGCSIKDIAKRLGVAKSSVSIWCSDIELSNVQIKKLHDQMVKGGYAGRLKGASVQKNNKQEKIKNYLEKGKEKFKFLEKRELLVAGLGLYWGEGGKNDSRVRLYNSNPDVVKFAMRWFRKALDVSDERFAMYVTINYIHKERLDEVNKYWSNVTGVSIEQFRKPVLIRVKSKKIYENHFQYHGTLCIRIARSSELFYKIMGLIKALGEAA